MTLFAFYNYFDLPLKPLASFLNLLLQVLMCFLNFVFSLNLKWHCLHLTNISTLILDLWTVCTKGLLSESKMMLLVFKFCN